MKFLTLLLGMVIFVAVLYQTVFTPAIKPQVQQETPKISPAMETLKQAQELKQKLNNQPNAMDFEERMKNR